MKCDRKTMLLYAVTDRAWTGEQTLYEQVEAALRGGATCVQLREQDLFSVASPCRKMAVTATVPMGRVSYLSSFKELYISTSVTCQARVTLRSPAMRTAFTWVRMTWLPRRFASASVRT